MFLQNTRFQLSIFPTLILILCLSVLVGCTDNDNRSSQEYIHSAKDKIAQNDHAAALIELKNALKLKPENANARWLIAEEFFILGDFVSAADNYQRAMDSGVDPSAAYPRLVEARLQAGQYDKVLQVDIDSSFSQSAAADIRAIKSLAYLAVKNLKEATIESDAALKLKRDQVFPLLSRAALKATQGHEDEALAIIDQIININSNFTQAHILSGDIYFKKFQWSLAESSYSKAISAVHYVGVPHVRRAHTYLLMRDYERAAKEVEVLNNAGVRSRTIEYISGVISLRSDDLENAKLHFNKALELDPTHLMSQYFLAVIYQRSDSSLAKELSERVVSRAPQFIPGRVLLAKLRIGDGDFARAEDLLLPVYNSRIKASEPAQLLYLAYLRQRKFEQAIQVLESLISNQENTSKELIIELGVAKMASGNAQQAVDLLSQLVQENGSKDLNLITRLVQAQVHAGIGDQAIESVNELIEQKPESASAHNLLGLVLLAEKRFTDAIVAMKTAVRLDKDGTSGAALNLSRLLLQQKKAGEALNIINEFESKFGETADAKQVLALIAETSNDYDAAENHLTSALSLKPESASTRIKLAEIRLNKGEYKLALEVIEPLEERLNLTSGTRLLMAKILFENNLLNRAEKILGSLRESDPRLIQGRILLLRIYERQGRLSKYEEDLSSLFKLSPNSRILKTEKVRLFLRKGMVTEAGQLLRDLDIKDTHPLRLAVDARLAFKSGDMKTAIAKGSVLLDSVPNEDNALFQVRAFHASGQHKAAIQLANEWLEKSSNSLELLIELANLQTKLNMDQQFEETLLEILRVDPDNTYALNGLAWRMKEREPKKALDYAERAYLHLPDSAAVIDTLATVQMFNQLGEAALETVNRAIRLHESNPALRITLSKVLIHLGRDDDAVRQIDWVLNQKVSPQLMIEANDLRNKISE